ncbi:MAG: hypothetical protein ACUVRD_03205 [Bacteroidia bacterium]
MWLFFLWAQGWEKIAENTMQAQKIAVDLLENVYLLAPEKNALYKLWAPRYDSISRIGGMGLGTESFNYPTQLAIAPPQQVYVLDFNSQRILVLNTNLQPQQTFTLSEAQLPSRITVQSFTLSPTGNLYLLALEDARVYKLDVFGRYLLDFGGKTYGEGQLITPVSLWATEKEILILDTTLKKIQRYNSWGQYMGFYSPPAADWQKAHFTLRGIVWQKGSSLKDLPQLPQAPLDVSATYKTFWALTPKAIYRYVP